MTTLKNIRNFICFNQKELIQYEYLVSEEHKKLRRYISNPDHEIIANDLDDLLQSLIDVAYGNLLVILEENVNKINELFESIGVKKDFRITIKTLEKDTVLDFFRSHVSATLKTSLIKKNTGFSKIMNSSKEMSFLSHDLQKDFLNEEYINPRLDNELREKLIKGQVTWEDCWIPIEGIDENFYYSSTLIIPMAIRINENDSLHFVNKFSKNIDHAEELRTVWGFLCFDSEEKNIFADHEDELKDVGYIVADVLSLYLMFFYNHISGSDTFNDAIKILNDINKEIL